MNQQRRVTLRVAPLDSFLARVRRELRVPSQAVTVAFVTDAAIHKMNRTYRGKDKPTDVLSFPVDAQAAAGFSRAKLRNSAGLKAAATRNGASYLGDIAIAPGVARRNARRFGRTLDGELRILILHGVLHLLGYDHETDQGQMDRVEARWRRRLGLESGAAHRARKRP